MRITTQMLNESARKAGLPLDNHSLLDYINTDKSSSSLMDDKQSILEATRNAASGREYRKLWLSAESLGAQAEKFAAEGEKNIFAGAEGGDTSKICGEAVKLAEGYNEMLEMLKKNPDGMNAFYLKALKEIAGDGRQALESVGITVGKDGALSVDKDKLAAADAEALAKAFGADGSFAPGVSFIAAKVADSARAEAESLSSVYGANGRQTDMGSYGKYDFWG
ncbi:MAG: hypothetical protein NC223_04545 [Butyrivibrio sp.]|nr:hypothetical protein [Butyrivibrio sp.]